jgi:hypothetical protein
MIRMLARASAVRSDVRRPGAGDRWRRAHRQCAPVREPGEFVRVEITDVIENDLKAEIQ